MNATSEDRIKRWQSVMPSTGIGAAISIVAVFEAKNYGFFLPRYLLGLVLFGIVSQISVCYWQIRRLRKKSLGKSIGGKLQG